MAIYIGGDTQELEYNFSTKVVGSMTECPMKIYSNSVDATNLPKSIDSTWKEITNQNFIDKLKNQDGDSVVETTNNEVLGSIINTNAQCDGMMNVEIGGNTLQNLINIKELSNITVKSENSFEAMLWAGTLLENSQVLNIFKPNTTYTLKVKYILKTTSDLQVFSPRIGFNLYSPNTDSFEFGQTDTLVKVDDVEYINITFTTPNNLEDKKLIFHTKRFTNETKVELGTVLVEDLMILEGDWTNYNLSYFEGIKSVGELEGNKIEVLSRGKNICSVDNINISGLTPNAWYNPITKQTTINYNDGVPIIIKRNVSYVLSLLMLNGTDLQLINANGSIVMASDVSTRIKIFPNDDIIYLRIKTDANGTFNATNIQLEEGTTATTYEPYKEDKIDIQLKEPLRGLPNGVRDTISGDIITRRVGMTTFVDFREWEVFKKGENYTTFIVSFTEAKANRGCLISNKFQLKIDYTTDISEGIFTSQRTPTNLFLEISNSKLETLDKLGFGVWLKEHPMVVYYELAEPIIEKLPQPLTLQSFKSGSVQVNSSIPPYVKEWHNTNKDDEGVLQYQSNTSGLSQAFLVELDLTGLCNSLFGGSNDVLRGNIKGLQLDTFAYGSGSNLEAEGYLAKTYWYIPSQSKWENWGQQNSTNIIKNITISKAEGQGAGLHITKDNKFYMLVVSDYPASDTIPSKLFLDYTDIKLKINRQPDKIEPLNVELGNEWSILIKGFSPSWDRVEGEKYLFWLKKGDENISFRHIETENIRRLGLQHNEGEWVKTPNMPTFRDKKFTSNNYLIQYKSYLYTVYHLDTQGLRKGVFKDDVRFSTGVYKFYLAQTSNSNFQADAFIENAQVLNQAFTDEEAEIILKGRNEIDVDNSYYNELAEIYQNPNICPELSEFNNSLAIIEEQSNDRLVISNTNTEDKSCEAFAFSPIVQLLPNNRYELIIDCQVKGDCEIFVLNKKPQYGEVITVIMGLKNGINKKVFTTTDTNCPTDSQCIRLDVNYWDSRLEVNKIELRRLD